ncbi:uncharacterized protein LOC129307225 [Prosopis cineraria]|uniref:uncharacterized protein LOC129307225 n=1 Tax=Prosopis cineraria TaxID=364024 RepID=UPI00240EE1BC|nr:uncharacterized protein LOC129307225 [Prosopis cineraria]
MKQQLLAQAALIDMLLKGQVLGRTLGEISPSQKDSCTVPSKKLPEDENDCNCLENTPKRRVVAIRRVYNIPEDTIHNHSLSPDCVRVSLLVAIDPNYPLPVPTDEAQTVGEAVGSFIAWPSHLIIVLRGKSKLKSKLGHTKESATVLQYPTAPVPAVEYKYHASLETYAMAMMMARQVAIGDIICFDNGLYGRSGLFEVVRNEILNEIIKHKMANTSLMSFYMRAMVLYRTMTNKTLSPSLRVSDSCETWVTVKYFEDAYCIQYAAAHIEEILEEVAQVVFNM